MKKILFLAVLGLTFNVAYANVCPNPKAAITAITEVIKIRKDRTIQGIGIEIAGKTFVVAEILGKIHLPIAPDTFSALPLDRDFKDEFLKRRTSAENAKTTNICGFMQEDTTGQGGGAYIYLTSKN